jgi:hypothetical protein
MNLMYDVFWYRLLMYGGWTMHGDHEHCMVDEFAVVWCLLVLTFGIWWMNYVCWIMVVYMFSFRYWFLMDNGCLYICLTFGTDFLWMMVVYMFIFCTKFWWITVAMGSSASLCPLLLRSHWKQAHDVSRPLLLWSDSHVSDPTFQLIQWIWINNGE